MNKKSHTRLATLRWVLGVTQSHLAERCGLSTVYVKKLENGSKPITRRVAIALSSATGVGVSWLSGKGKRFPIVTDFGRAWTTAISEQIQQRRRDKGATEREAKMCARLFVIYADKMARILYSAFEKKKTSLALALIEDSMNEIGKRFSKKAWPKRKEFERTEVQGGYGTQYLSGRYTPEQAVAGIAGRLKANLNAIVNQTAFTTDTRHPS